ncbi:PucR family transcriptional regulator [Actinokineospora sp. HUAS TT18]|uniref:PucR family transcriptional regulator n=1 Tax=Actinokineospora sp. HUAS TT18 TaxID=3447451 RepID=UPI003F51ADE0
MKRTTPPDAIVGVAYVLLDRIDDLGLRLARRMRSEIESYGNEAQVPFETIRVSCTRNLRLMALHFTTTAPVDPEPPKETGRLRAQQGVPLAETLHAYRIGFEFLWSEMVAEARRQPAVTDAMLVSLAAEVWWLAGEYSVAVAAAYRETTSELMLQREHERSVLVEALFTGVIADSNTLGETARILGLPATGRFAVVAADVLAPGREALPGIEASLRSARVASAWRLLPDQQIGVVSFAPALEETALKALRKHRARVGVSPPYESLRETPQALRFARLALAGLHGKRSGVARFDDNPLAMVVAAAPAEADRMVRLRLGAVLDLPQEERVRLLETLDHWFAAGGSATETGRRLYIHPNTVRYRRRRVEDLTGRSLDDPQAILDLGAALQALPVLRARENQSEEVPSN